MACYRGNNFNTPSASLSLLTGSRTRSCVSLNVKSKGQNSAMLHCAFTPSSLSLSSTSSFSESSLGLVLNSSIGKTTGKRRDLVVRAAKNKFCQTKRNRSQKSHNVAKDTSVFLTISVMSCKILIVLLIGVLAWVYQSFIPPPPRICGSVGGPSIKGPRIKLRDGRHLAYMEHGVPRETAKYKIILVHGFSGCKLDGAALATSELVVKLGIYFVSFDRPGYGESDPDPKRTMKSLALDIEELGDQLELGSKFYIIGVSMGGQVVWGCLKYIPHRLAGATLIVPVVNYWWPSFPSKLATEAYCEQSCQDQWALRVAHHAPWLVYWWNTQKWFPGSSVAAGRPNFSAPDLQLISKFASRISNREYATQQGVYESLHRDMKIGFGRWDFDPMTLDNPFPDGEGSVHLWQGVQDALVPISLQRYIVRKLSWIKYHELPDAGHLFAYADNAAKDAILNALLIGDK